MKKTAVLLVAFLCLSLLFVSCEKIPDDEKTPSEWEMPYQFDLSEYVTLGEYKGLPATKVEAVVTEAEIDARIQAALDEKKVENEITDRPAQEGDTLNIDFTGYMDGEAFDNGAAAGETIVLGSAGYIEGFEDAIVGHSAGEEFTIDVTFPDPYSNNPDFAGRPAQFVIKINSIKEYSYPELTDELVAEISEYKTVAEYREAIKMEMLEDKTFDNHMNLKNTLWEQFFETCTIKSYPDAEIAEKKEPYLSQAESMGTTFEELYGASMEDLEEYAKNFVGQEMVYFAVAKAENIVPTQEQFDDLIELYATWYGATEKELVEQIGEDAIWRSVLWDQVMEFIADHADYTK